MKSSTHLSGFELMVMLAVIRLGEEAYGVPISRTIEECTGGEVVLGSVYAALARLEERGLVTSRVGEATAERGGRAKKYFQVTAKGLRDLRDAHRALNRLWEGLPQLEGTKA